MHIFSYKYNMILHPANTFTLTHTNYTHADSHIYSIAFQLLFIFSFFVVIFNLLTKKLILHTIRIIRMLVQHTKNVNIVNSHITVFSYISCFYCYVCFTIVSMYLSMISARPHKFLYISFLIYNHFVLSDSTKLSKIQRKKIHIELFLITFLVKQISVLCSICKQPDRVQSYDISFDVHDTSGLYKSLHKELEISIILIVIIIIFLYYAQQ